MRVSAIKLLNIRRFDTFEVAKFSERLNVIVGPNAWGKTSILEALHLTTQLESFRATRIQELIKSDKSEASVSVRFTEPAFSDVLVGFNQEGRQIKVDGVKISSKTKYPYLGSSVCFVPDDLYLIKGSSDLRRHYLDDLLVGMESGYASQLTKFEKVLKQRNQLLKKFRDSVFVDSSEYDLWTEQFVVSAGDIYTARAKAVSILAQLLPKLYSDLFGQAELSTIRYIHQVTEGDWKKSLTQRLKEREVAEKALGYTLIGPHRDDIEFELKGLDAKTFASQGQVRGLVIALKIAQLELSRWDKPLLLLDDIVSELDDTRVHALIRYLSNYPGQLFVTTAEIAKLKALHLQFKDFELVSLDGVEKSVFTSQKQLVFNP